MVLSAVLSLVALASIVAASPVNQDRTVRIRGTQRNNLFRRTDGTLDYNVLKADILKTKAKYSKQFSNKKGNKRAVGTEVLTDDISGGIDVGYYGPISVGTPAQIIRRYPIFLGGCGKLISGSLSQRLHLTQAQPVSSLMRRLYTSH